MPNKTIYIRNEDEEAWNRIADKPRWIHEALNSITKPKIIKTPTDARQAVKTLPPPVTYTPKSNWGA